MRHRPMLCGFLLCLAFLLASCGAKSPMVPMPCQDIDHLTPACFDAMYARYSPFLEATTHIAVGLYLAEFPQRAHATHRVILQVQARLDQEQLTTLQQLEGVVLDQVQWDTLEPGMQQGVKLLIRAVRTSLEGFLFDAKVTEPEQVRVVTTDVVRWVQSAVVVSCPDCTQAVLREMRR